MIAVIGWYAIATLFGWLALPLAFRLLPGLPDRGYTLSRALGLLLSGYVFWMLGSLGFLHNDLGGILLSMLVVGGVSLWVYTSWGDRSEHLLDWLRTHGALIFTAELVFLVTFAGWAFVRAYNPEISGTEKPMELTFLNGVRGSPGMPPRDPWLSGYAISYYYFGYVIVVMLARLSATATAVAFNLGIALLFALTALGAYGLVHNLVAAWQAGRNPGKAPPGLTMSALLGPLFVGVMGNLEGALDLLHSLNVPFIPGSFWTWLDILDINQPPTSVQWPLSTWRYLWWWRASRVVQDRDAAGLSIGLPAHRRVPVLQLSAG